MRFRQLALVTVLLASTAPMAIAQAVGRDRARALLTARFQDLRNDRALPDSLRNLSLDAIISPRNTAFARWLDDAGIQLYYRGLASLTYQLPPERCGAILDPNADGGTDLNAVLAYSDSASLAMWADVLERVVRVRAAGHAAGRVAPRPEMQGTIMAAMGRLSVEDQTRLITIARNPPAKPVDACWSVQQMMTMLSQLPPDSLGPAGRAMFGAQPGE